MGKIETNQFVYFDCGATCFNFLETLTNLHANALIYKHSGALLSDIDIFFIFFKRD